MPLKESKIPEKLLNRLLEAAVAVKDRAYNPYSNFNVGAAVLSTNNKIFEGCNFETANYDIVCAERSAISHAALKGYYRFKAVAISSNVTEGTTSPCGRCRQFLREMIEGKPIDYEIHLINAAGKHEMYTLEELLPKSFGPEDLFDEVKMDQINQKYRNRHPSKNESYEG